MESISDHESGLLVAKFSTKVGQAEKLEQHTRRSCWRLIEEHSYAEMDVLLKYITILARLYHSCGDDKSQSMGASGRIGLDRRAGLHELWAQACMN